MSAQGCQKQKEHAEITFRDYLGETVLDRLWNYFGETVRDILKNDLKDDFRRGFECGRYNTQVPFEQCCEVPYHNPKGFRSPHPNPEGTPRSSKVLRIPKGPPTPQRLLSHHFNTFLRLYYIFSEQIIILGNYFGETVRYVLKDDF